MVLFNGGHLVDWLGQRTRKAVEAVATVDGERLRFSPEEVVETVVDRFSLAPVTYDWERLSRSEIRELHRDTFEFGRPIRHPAQGLTIHVPVIGDTEVLTMRASTFRHDGGIQATVADDELSFPIADTTLSAELIQSRVAAMRSNLEEQTGWTNRDVGQWAESMRRAVTDAVNRRKQQLDAMAQTSAGLEIPLRPAPGARQVQIPLARKAVRVTRQRTTADVTGRAGEAEPQLSSAIYEDVVRTIRALANSMERLPRTARRFNEEEFRDLILFVLNSNYEGLARGEVFNGEGKTDILVPYGDHNAFIGECKVWRGSRQFNAAIDQLLGYTVWRDTKAAILLFIKTGDVTDVITKADAVLRAHPGFVSSKPRSDASDRADYLMHATDDASRHIQLALLPVVIRQPED